MAPANGTEILANSSYPVAAVVGTLFSGLPVGPDYVYVYHIDWKFLNVFGSLGKVDVAYTLYNRKYEWRGWSTRPAPSIWFYPTNPLVAMTWDGMQIGSVKTGNTVLTEGSFKVPAVPMGPPRYIRYMATGTPSSTMLSNLASSCSRARSAAGKPSTSRSGATRTTSRFGSGARRARRRCRSRRSRRAASAARTLMSRCQCQPGRQTERPRCRAMGVMATCR